MSNERMSLNDIQHALMKALYRPGSPVTSDETDAAMDALGGLVAAEADGQLVRLPRKIGERVYEIFRTSDCNGFHNCLCLCSGMIEGHKVMEPCPYYDAETDDCKGAFDKNREWNVRCVPFQWKHMQDITKGGYIFITREEAEAALEEETKAEAALKGRLHNEQTDAPES